MLTFRTHLKPMACCCLLILALLVCSFEVVGAAELDLTSPLDHQVVQRTTPGKGTLRITGQLSEDAPGDVVVEARLLDGQKEAAWQRLNAKVVGRAISGMLEAPAGGWRKLEVRVTREGKEFATSSVEHVGIGEVFVVAGQSNSANHGEEKLTPQTGRVAAFDGTKWRIANDPQPGASGGGGSFIPAFGDAVARKLDVPVGIVACGIGATSVREWLPKGSMFRNPPTLTGRVEPLPNGEWASKGEAFAMFVSRMKSLGPNGFRAVLWHQGESDANQADPTRTLPGKVYRESLEKVIRESRREIGWDVPWFVAQVSYHVPGDEASPDIRAAQASLWKDGIALEGPDSDALKVDLRERNGQGVHFSGKGQREHGVKWAEKVLPWLDQQWTALRAVGGGTEWSDTQQLAECHSIGWVANWMRADPQGRGKAWDGVLDEAKWGKPSPDQLVVRNWDWRFTDAQWRQAVVERGEGPRDEVKFDLWIPDGVEVVKGIVVMSGHGSGESLYGHPSIAPKLRAIARELHLAIFKFVGNPMQRGFWPKSLLYDRLNDMGQRARHPELAHAPLFLYGHSNGTGFSALFPATEGHRVWGWVSMRPGIAFQVYQPGAAQVPGLVIFGEDDPFLARPSKAENLAVVSLMRKKHNAVWNFAVEPKTGHGPGDKTWPLVFSFLRHTFNSRVPADADPRQGPIQLKSIAIGSGHLGTNWDAAKGGYQTLSIAPHADFAGDKSSASWLINADYAADWQSFQRDGEVKPAK